MKQPISSPLNSTFSPFTAPTLKPARQLVPEEQARRLLLGQILATQLENNTQRLLDTGLWPRKEDKLFTALGHRVGELFDRYYQRTQEHEVQWLNTVISLSEGATISILALAIQADPAKIAEATRLLNALAHLAGTLKEEEAGESSE